MSKQQSYKVQVLTTPQMVGVGKQFRPKPAR